MKTAVEWLVEELGEYFPHEIGGIHLMIKQAKEMEKQQIINAWEDVGTDGVTTGKEYYKQTFKSE